MNDWIKGILLVLMIWGFMFVVAFMAKDIELKPLTPTEVWYVDRRFGVDWEFKTKEEARESAGSGRIYSQIKYRSK